MKLSDFMETTNNLLKLPKMSLLEAMRSHRKNLNQLKDEASGPGKHEVYMELYEAGSHLNNAIFAEENRQHIWKHI